ncbi:hypothetical protein J3F83DRAFT_457126 [Trichoderma novae-zelandiae]
MLFVSFRLPSPRVPSSHWGMDAMYHMYRCIGPAPLGQKNTEHKRRRCRNREEEKKKRRKPKNSGKPGCRCYTVPYLHVRHRSVDWPNPTAQLMHGCISQRWRLMASCFSFPGLWHWMNRYAVGGKHQMLRRPRLVSPAQYGAVPLVGSSWMEPFGTLGTPAVNARVQGLDAFAFSPSVPGSSDSRCRTSGVKLKMAPVSISILRCLLDGANSGRWPPS